MDIQQAKTLIAGIIKSKTDELAVFQLASDILNSTFTAEFTNLETAQREANEKSAEVAKKNTEISEKETKITELAAEIADKNNLILDQQTQIETLQTATALTEPITP